MNTSALRLATIAATATAVTLTAAGVASAAEVNPQICPTGTSYSTYDKRSGYAPTDESSFQAAGPFTISYSETQTASHSFGANAEFSFSASAIIASAKATFGVNYTYTSSSSRSWSYSTYIPAGKTGKAVVFHRTDNMYFDKYVDHSNCTTSAYRNGIADIPVSNTDSGTYCIIRDFKPYRTKWQSSCSGE